LMRARSNIVIFRSSFYSVAGINILVWI
jgi:hypothetical protein